MQSGLGQPKLPRRNRQGRPGLERPQREGGDRDKDRDREHGSTDTAGPARFRGTGLGSGLWLRTIKVPPWETRLQWGFGWDAPTPK